MFTKNHTSLYHNRNREYLLFVLYTYGHNIHIYTYELLYVHRSTHTWDYTFDKLGNSTTTTHPTTTVKPLLCESNKRFPGKEWKRDVVEYGGFQEAVSYKTNITVYKLK